MTAENRMKEICKNLYDIVSDFVKEKVGKDVCFYKSIYLKTTDGEQIILILVLSNKLKNVLI